MPSNSTWNVTGIEFDGAHFVAQPIVYEMKGAKVSSVSSFGTPITCRAAQKMIVKDKWDASISQLNNLLAAGKTEQDPEVKALLDTNISVTFSKSILLFLLSQADCAGIKFYFCKNLDGKDSLVLVGVDENNGDLESTNGVIVPLSDTNLAARGSVEKTVLAEVGGPKKLGHVLEHELVETRYDKTVREYFMTGLNLRNE